MSQKNVAASIWWLQTWLGVTEKRWLRPPLSGGKSLYAGAAVADLGSYHRSLTATTSAGGAVGEADCDWAGEQPTRSCYFRGEELRAGIYCEPPNRLGPLPVVFEAPVYGVPGSFGAWGHQTTMLEVRPSGPLCKLSDHTGGMGDLLLVIEGSLGSSSV